MILGCPHLDSRQGGQLWWNVSSRCSNYFNRNSHLWMKPVVYSSSFVVRETAEVAAFKISYGIAKIGFDLLNILAGWMVNYWWHDMDNFIKYSDYSDEIPNRGLWAMSSIYANRTSIWKLLEIANWFCCCLGKSCQKQYSITAVDEQYNMKEDIVK